MSYTEIAPGTHLTRADVRQIDAPVGTLLVDRYDRVWRREASGDWSLPVISASEFIWPQSGPWTVARWGIGMIPWQGDPLSDTALARVLYEDIRHHWTVIPEMPVGALLELATLAVTHYPWAVVDPHGHECRSTIAAHPSVREVVFLLVEHGFEGELFQGVPDDEIDRVRVRYGLEA